jgi:hypothetical protein
MHSPACTFDASPKLQPAVHPCHKRYSRMSFDNNNPPRLLLLLLHS